MVKIKVTVEEFVGGETKRTEWYSGIDMLTPDNDKRRAT